MQNLGGQTKSIMLFSEMAYFFAITYKKKEEEKKAIRKSFILTWNVDYVLNDPFIAVFLA